MKTATNPLPKSMRGKHRYISFSCEKKGIDGKALFRAFNDTMLFLFGASGTAQSGFSLVIFNEQTGKGAIKVDLGWEKKMLPAFAFLSEKLGAGITSKKASGTLITLKPWIESH